MQQGLMQQGLMQQGLRRRRFLCKATWQLARKRSRQRNQDYILIQDMRNFAMPTRTVLLLPIQNRIVRLQQLIFILEEGRNVPLSDMRHVVEPDILNSLQLELENTILPIPGGRRPRAVDVYANLLRVADQLDTRPRAKQAQLSKRSLSSQRTRLRSAETAYARALEFLEEQTECDLTILNWLDRRPNFNSHDESPSPEASDVPRLLTSRSRYARGYYGIKNQQLQRKIAVLRSCVEICVAD
jgi:hypothetical protein